MDIDKLFNLLHWCGYKIDIQSTIYDKNSYTFQATVYNDKYLAGLYGESCARYEVAISSVLSKLILYDPIFATLVAYVSIGGFCSNYDQLIKQIRDKYDNQQKT